MAPGTDLKDFSGRLEGYRWVLTLVKEQYRSRGLSEGLDVGGTNRSERVGRASIGTGLRSPNLSLRLRDKETEPTKRPGKLLGGRADLHRPSRTVPHQSESA